MGLQQTLRAPADPIRREILNLLKDGKFSAGEIAAHFPVTAASISRHPIGAEGGRPHTGPAGGEAKWPL